jgi:hypothetical protein
MNRIIGTFPTHKSDLIVWRFVVNRLSCDDFYAFSDFARFVASLFRIVVHNVQKQTVKININHLAWYSTKKWVSLAIQCFKPKAA